MEHHFGKKEITNADLSKWFSLDLILIVVIIVFQIVVSYLQYNGGIPIKDIINRLKNNFSTNQHLIFATYDGFWLQEGSQPSEKILNYGSDLTLSQDKNSIYFLADGSVENLNLKSKNLTPIVEKENNQYIIGYIFYSNNEIIYWTSEDITKHTLRHKFIDATNYDQIVYNTQEILSPIYWRNDNKILLQGYQTGYQKVWLFDLITKKFVNTSENIYNGWDGNFIESSHGLYYLALDKERTNFGKVCEAHQQLVIKSVDNNRTVLTIDGAGQMVNTLGFSPKADQLLVSIFSISNQVSEIQGCDHIQNLKYFVYDLTKGERQEVTNPDEILAKWNNGFIGATINDQQLIQYKNKTIENQKTYKILLQYLK